MDKKIDLAELLARGVANIIPGKDNLENLLTSDKKINIYLGIDPTATKIHLGHAVQLRKLQAFVDLVKSSNATFLIGDFTALIGDTSDKDSERPLLTSEQIEENFKTYKKQAEKIIDFSKVKIAYNSEWLSKLNFKEVIKLCAQFSFGDFASRELIANRLKDKKNVGLHEALYPVMQGYDSYYMDTDIQIGGTDQTFNMQAGRILQKKWRNKESFVLATEFLIGTDGQKMSKTGGNAIWLDDKPEEMYAKVMSIKDDALYNYFRLATNIPLDEINYTVETRLQKEKENPIIIKKELAFHLVKEFHSIEQAQKAQKVFEETVQNKKLPTYIPIYSPYTLVSNATITDALVASGMAPSRSEAKRVIEQGGIQYDGETITNPNEPFIPKEGKILQKGKHTFRKIKTK